MVKFSQDSHYYSIVRAKLSQILRPTPQPQDDIDSDGQSCNVLHTVSDDVIRPFQQIDSASTTTSVAGSLPLLQPPRSIFGKRNLVSLLYFNHPLTSYISGSREVQESITTH